MFKSEWPTKPARDTLSEKICESIEAVPQGFCDNELAYLAATGKIESVFRDKIAFNLHNQNQTTLIVLREWRRIDIAIFANATDKIPRGLIEIKSAYSFDGCLGDGIFRYFEYLKKDLSKNRTRFSGVPLTAILIAAHLEDFPEDNPIIDILKYSQWHRKARAAFNQEEVKEKLLYGAKETIKSVGFEQIKQGKIPAGTAFGIPVTVFYWVLKVNQSG